MLIFIISLGIITFIISAIAIIFINLLECDGIRPKKCKLCKGKDIQPIIIGWNIYENVFWTWKCNTCGHIWNKNIPDINGRFSQEIRRYKKKKIAKNKEEL